MRASTLHPAQRRSAAARAALFATAAGLLLAGCGGATEPVASHRAAASTAGVPAEVSAPASATAPTSTETTQAPAGTPDGGAEATPATAPADPVSLAPEELADIDRLLAGMDTHLADVANDAATPEGDLG